MRRQSFMPTKRATRGWPSGKPGKYRKGIFGRSRGKAKVRARRKL